jgi:predicted O-methyltransferase YrrM
VKFEAVQAKVAGIPYIGGRNARILYDWIIEHELRDCLELGFAHGVASCYMAAALDELGHGHLTSVDLLAAQEWQNPSIEELLERCGLSSRVTVIREHSGYNWYLHDAIQRQTTKDGCAPCFDFCIIDGPKNWTIDGLAFFLVDKLLRPGAWILFDDYQWTYAESAKGEDSLDGLSLRNLSEAELTTPHVQEIFHLLVMQHPNYGNFRVQSLHSAQEWPWAQKIPECQTREFVVEHRETYRDLISSVALRLRRRLRSIRSGSQATR